MRRLVARGYVPAAVAALVAVILVAQALSLWRSYEAAWLLAVRSAENVMHTVASNIERNLSVFELSLRGLGESIAVPGLGELSPELRRMVLFDRAATAQYLGSMLVLDAEGNIVDDSGSVPPRTGNFADRDYFLAQRAEDAGTYVSQPYASRLRSGDPSIALSRRVSGPDGSFRGVVVGAMRIAYFESLLGNVNLGPKSVVAITRADGTVLLRHPSTDGKGNTGANIATSPVFQRMIRTPGAPFADRSIFDGVDRYYIHTLIGGFPLLLSVGISTEAAMRGWMQDALISSALTVGMCVLMILMFRALRLALLRSREVEERLEVLAVTDELTGLPNRRAFDLAMNTEMRRAARERVPLAVLLIDIDHFKRVNDRHGHNVGDVVLARVAEQIGRSIRRPGDFAARYGGEEFVVILPSTDATGARHMAERIRTAISALVPCPTQPSLKSITASIGLVSRKLQPGEVASELVSQADQALYAAKGAGRNQVVVHGQDAPARVPQESKT